MSWEQAECGERTEDGIGAWAADRRQEKAMRGVLQRMGLIGPIGLMCSDGYAETPLRQLHDGVVLHYTNGLGDG